MRLIDLLRRVALASTLLFLASGCALIPTGSGPDTQGTVEESTLGVKACVPTFEDRGGWLGGDAAFSVVLDSQDETTRRTLWLFGDTFVGRPDSGGRRTYPFIHNSIGLSRCDAEGRFRMETHWRGRDGAEPMAFFIPTLRGASAGENDPDRADYYWPVDGFVSKGRLFIGLLRIQHSEPRGPFALPFRIRGMDLARIENPGDPPERWQIELSRLSKGAGWQPGASFVVDRGHVYAFAFDDRESGRSPRILMRLPLSSLASWCADLSGKLETLDQQGQWRADLPPEEAAIVLPDDGTEMSVHFDESRARWLAVDMSPLPASERTEPGGQIRIRQAKSLEGPWSEPISLSVIPELAAASGQDANVFCYAAKAHPQFSNRQTLLVTYVCNLFARTPAEVMGILRRLADSPGLYRPRSIHVPIPLPAEFGAPPGASLQTAPEAPAPTAPHSDSSLVPPLRTQIDRSSQPGAGALAIGSK